MDFLWGRRGLGYSRTIFSGLEKGKNVDFFLLDWKFVVYVIYTKFSTFEVFFSEFFWGREKYVGSFTETVAFQVHEILKINHEFLQFFWLGSKI